MNSISPQQAKKLVDEKNAVLIDVRTAAEFQQSHIASACSIPLAELDNQFEQLNVSDVQTVILQCQKGMRGQQAQQLLIKKTNKPELFVNMDGGIEAWQQADLPVIGEPLQSKAIAMPRQVQITSGLMVLLFSFLTLSGASWAIYVLTVMGAMMVFSGASGWCGMVQLLMKMPWNKP